MTRAFADPRVLAAFAALPDKAQPRLRTVRDLIFNIAAETPGVGEIEEALKWGQPAYLTPETKSGSTLRLGVTKSAEPAIFAHCQTTIISDFQAQFPDEFRYQGNRAVILPEEPGLSTAPLRHLIASALTYHLRKR